MENNWLWHMIQVFVLSVILYVADLYPYVCVFISDDLLLVDVENKDVTYTKKTPHKVTSLVWVQQEKPDKKETIDSVLIEVIKFMIEPI
jgi:hypothetical protein